MASSQRPTENPMEDIQQTSLTSFDEIHANVKEAIDAPTGPSAKRVKTQYQPSPNTTPPTPEILLKSGDSRLPPTNPSMTSPHQNTTTSVGNLMIMQTDSIPTLPNVNTLDRLPGNIPTPDHAEPSTNPNPWADPSKQQNQQISPDSSTNPIDPDAMETESNATIEPDVPRKLYSRAHAPSKRIKRTTTDWITETLKIIARRRDLTFDSNSWNYETIIEAFDSPEKLEQFLSHKLRSIPTQFNIPTAINQKIQYMDTAFFRSFTRDKDVAPAHQKEFDSLFEMALEKFRRHNDVRFVNKVNRQQIYEKLRIKLAVDYLCNLDFLLLRPHDCARHIFYCLNLAKISPKLTFEQTRTCLYSLHENLLLPLPTHPQDIDEEILAALPYSLPLADRRNTRAILTSLRKVYKFEQLPETYFEYSIIPLPYDIEELHPSVRNLFPITDWDTLKCLGEYRQKLKVYYSFERIHAEFFHLPAEKEKLPTTIHALNSAVRHLFPCDPKDSTELCNLVKQLREHYSFKRIPNDFFVQKPNLPADPYRVKTQLKYTFPITDDGLAKEFIKEIEGNYKFNWPIPLHYMTANPTDLPNLPKDHNLVDKDKVNLTIPIRSSKSLVETSRQLRSYYYFHRIPESWIEIVDNTDGRPNLPTDLEKAIVATTQIEECKHLQLPIREYNDIQTTIETLRKHFRFRSFPTSFIHVPDLPPPSWSMFDNYSPSK
jgi:hypothetical protein